MRTMYILDENDITKAKDRLKELRHIALLSRDAGEMQDNREYFLRAKGFEDALRILGVIKQPG